MIFLIGFWGEGNPQNAIIYAARSVGIAFLIRI